MNFLRPGRVARLLMIGFLVTASGYTDVVCRAEEAKSTDSAASDSRETESMQGAVTVRGDLNHSRTVFANSGKGRVAFLGGSITEMNGYRPMVVESLKKRFPTTEFEFNNAGVSSTCSNTGAFRLPTDVLSKNPDLLFVEFAVNDDQDAAHSYDDAVRGMEGIVRSARSKLPKLDIVITHFVNPSMLQTVQNGNVPTSIRAHEAVAEHYNISTCNVAVELADQIAKGKTTWTIYGGVHPKPAGNRIAADLIEDVFRQTKFSLADAAKTEPRTEKTRPMPEPIDPRSFARGRFLSRDAIVMGDDWSYSEPNWKDIPGSFREHFSGRPLTVSTVPGSELNVSFSGTAIGLFVLAGPDAGAVEFSIDDGPWQTVDLYHRFSKGLHYPRTVVLSSDLSDQPHEMKLRVSKKKNQESNGNAVRILEFVVS